MSNVGNAQSQLAQAWRTLQRQWQTTGEQWRDSVQRRFQRDMWQEFERTVPAALNEMKRLADVIAQARHEAP